MNVLKLINICKKYGDKNALTDVCFEVNTGEIVGLIGPNGAGKTTIFKVISGLINSDSGELIKNGDISGIISKTPLYPFLTGREHLKYISKINNKSNIDELEKFIGIGKKITDKVSTYSLGMKQRLCLGILLINDSEIILLDEPTNGLDNKGIIELRDLLRKLAEERKKTIIISSHNLREIDILCNKIIFVNNGKIVKITNKELENHNSPFIIKFNTNEVNKINKLRNEYGLSINDNLVTITIDEDHVKNLLEFIIMNNVRFRNLEIIRLANYDLESKYNLYINGGRIDGVI
ncbi:ABC transporter ATP-binding protein [Clostridium sp. DL1XJH146]